MYKSITKKGKIRKITNKETAAASGKKLGRPPFEPTKEQEHQVESLTAMGASEESICDFLNIEQETLKKYFSEALKNGRSRVSNRLRMLQLKKAYAGHPTMLIWLGKQLLGQSEKKTLVVEEADGFEFEYKDEA